MIRIKVYKLSQVIGAAVLAVLLIVAIVVGIRVFAGAQDSPTLGQESAGVSASAGAPAADKPQALRTWLPDGEEAVPSPPRGKRATRRRRGPHPRGDLQDRGGVRGRT